MSPRREMNWVSPFLTECERCSASPKGESLPPIRSILFLAHAMGAWGPERRTGWRAGRAEHSPPTKNLANGIRGIVEDHARDIWIVRWDTDDGHGPLCRI